MDWLTVAHWVLWAAVAGLVLLLVGLSAALFMGPGACDEAHETRTLQDLARRRAAREAFQEGRRGGR